MMHEAKRLAALYELDILTGPREPALDQIARLARLEFETEHAGIMMLDTTTARFVARANIAVKSIPREEVFCNIVIQQDTPLIIPDTWQDPTYSNNPQVALGIRSYVGIPLRTRSGYNVGSLCVLGTEPLDVTPKKIKTLQGLAKLAMQCIELRRLAIQDHLTGSLNRRGFMTELDRHLLHHAVRHADFSLALMDLDHFKQINDRFGHPVGDMVLQAVAALCEAACERGDLVGRLGGEEFGIILPGLNEAAAFPVIERLRKAIELIVLPQEPALRITASFGIIQAGPFATRSTAMMIKADAALYKAKAGGRNRTMLSQRETLSDAPQRLHPLAGSAA